MNKLEVGMYVRYTRGAINGYVPSKIGKILERLNDSEFIKLDTNCTILENDVIGEPSFNPIDLIEVGDYVNGYKVSFKDNDYKPFVQCDYPVQEGTTNHYRFYEEAIYSIVTKEQFKSMEYRLGDK